MHGSDFFGLKRAKVSARSEFRAGTTTFLAMSYILFVNPSILGTAIDFEGAGPQLLTATALAAAFGTLLMGLWARLPFALAPGMGLNAYFTYTVVIGQGIAWQTALGAVFISGLLFLIISLSGLRSALMEALPLSLKLAVTAGIGGFLTMIGLTGGGMVVDHPVTLVALGDLREPTPLLCALGLLIIAVLTARQVKGAILWGILVTAIVAIVSGAPVFGGTAFGGFDQGIIRLPVLPTDLFLAMDLKGAVALGAVSVIFTFLFVDFFDSVGTLVGLSEKANMLDPDGGPAHGRAAFGVDALATSFGAALGTSSTTAYIESAAGIEDGGRTGLTAVTTAGWFLLSLILWPLASAVPAAATAPALIMIGAMMMAPLARIDWQDPGCSIPALLTLMGMPLSYSITNGISLGIVSYCLIQIGMGKLRTLHPLMLVLTALLLARFAWMVGG